MRPNRKFLEELSEIGEIFFQEVFSDRTVKRQAYLIGFSLITILLSYSMISADSISFLGMKFDQKTIPKINSVFVICTIYILVTYWISAYSDWYFYKYKQIKAVAVIKELNQENINSIETKAAKRRTLLDEYMELNQSKKEIFDEIDQIRRTQDKEYLDLSVRLNRLIHEKKYAESSALFIEMEELSMQHNELMKPYDELVDEICNDQHADEISKKIELLSDFNYESERLESMRKIIAKYKRVIYFSILVEIVLPSSLGIASLFTTAKIF